MNSLKITYNEMFVGVCDFNPENKKMFFQYSSDFLKLGIELSPLLLPLENRIFEFDNLPPMLADSLPDDFGNKMFLQWLLKNNISQNMLSPLEKLCYIGKRGMGALEYEPAFEQKSINENLNIADLLEVANAIYFHKENESVPLNDYRQSLSTLLRIGTSVGGARAKALIAINEKTQEIKAGDILQEGDFEYYIIKFDGLKDGKEIEPGGYGILEYIYHKMALDSGIEMSDCRLFMENKRSHFLTKRFDREGGKKIHIQTLCAMADVDFRQPNLIGYEDIFRILNLLKMDYSEKEQLFRRMVFNVLAFNRDDHTKNFSFMYKDGKWKLAPAYDLIFAYNPESYWLRNHNININGKNNNITQKDLLAISEKFCIKKAESIVLKTSEVVQNFKYYADKYQYPKEKAEAVSDILSNFQVQL
ncbi:MAG: type II toxin-antitoxin system HipA family toxin [Fibromonadaceae bacterium]|jgi:serine/threonine-protein kinase HipA|nr:type II toxin-antitoxin system HipA family toxin [Fibromonadaceae bacterium]